MAQQQSNHKTPRPAEEEKQRSRRTPEMSKKAEELKEALDKLLDDVDEILEENAEEYVANYVQRGGQ